MTDHRDEHASLYHRYLQQLVKDPASPVCEAQFIPRHVRGPATGGHVRLADEPFQAVPKWALLGPAGCGKTTQLRHWAAQTAQEMMASTTDEGLRWLPLYIDLAQFQEAFELDSLVETALIAQGLYTSPDQRQALLAQAVPLLLLDNLDRVRDVHVLQGAAYLWQAAPDAAEAPTGKASWPAPTGGGSRSKHPHIILACRSEEWSAYQGWLQGLPQATLAPVDHAAASEALLAQLQAQADAPVAPTSVLYWLWRDPALEELTGHPVFLQAIVDAVRAQDISRAGVVERGMQKALELAVPQGAPSGRQALARLAWAMREEGRSALPPTQAKQIVAQADAPVGLHHLLGSGLLRPEGGEIRFTHPLLRAHSEACAWQDRLTATRPVPDTRNRDILLACFQMSSDQLTFLRSLLDLEGGVARVAEILTQQVDAGWASQWVRQLLCEEISPLTWYHLGQALTRVGQAEAGHLALQKALDTQEALGQPAPVDGTEETGDGLVSAWAEMVRQRWQGMVYRNLAQTKAALECFGQAREKVRLFYGDIWYQLGQIQMAQGDYPSAIPLFQKALLLRPDCAPWHYQMAVAYNRAGMALDSPGRRDGQAGDMAQRALAELQRAEELGQNPDALPGELALANEALGQLEAALACYQRARELEPHSALYHRRAAILLGQQGSSEDSFGAWRRALACDPGDAASHDALGQLFQQRSRFRQAMVHFRKAVELDPAQPAYRFRLGECWAALGDAPQATGHLREAVRSDPTQEAWHEALAKVLERQGLDAEAAEHYRQAANLQPQEAGYYLALGRLLRQQGQAAEALLSLQKALSLRPADPEILYHLGQMHADVGQDEQAIAAYQRACELNPSDTAIRRALAKAYLRQGDLIRAQGELRLAVRLDPSDVWALTQLSKVYDSTGHLRDALEALELAVRSAGSPEERAGCHLEAGKLALRLGEVDRARRKHLEEAVRLSPDRAEAYYTLGRVCQRQGELAQAAEACQKAIALAPNEPRYHAAWGEVAMGLGQLDEAQSEAARAVALAPQEAGFHAQLGLVERAMGHLSTAREHYHQAAALAGPQPDYHLALAQLYQAEGQWEKGRAHLEAALAADPKRADLHMAWGELHAEAGRMQEALASFARAVELSPQNLDYVDRYGACLIQAGQHQAAIQQLEQVLDQEPERGMARYHLGLALEWVGRAEEALKAYTQASVLLSDGSLAEVLYRLGKLALSLGHVPEATKALRQVVGLRPQWAEGCHALSLALERGQELEAALVQAREAARLEADHGDYHLHLGRVCNRLRQYDEAISALEKVLTLPMAPTPEVYSELGQAFEARGQEWWPEAAEAYQRAVDLAPEEALHQHRLGLLLSRTKDPRALDILRTAVRLNPQDHEAHFYLGQTCSQEGLWDEAEGHLRRARELDAVNPEYGYHLARGLYSAGHPHESLQVLEKVDKGPEGIFLRGQCQEALGDVEAALADYQQAALQSPRHVGPWHQQGLLLMATGRWDEATRALKKALTLAEEQGDRSLQASLHHQLGKAWKELAQPDAALTHLQSVVGLDSQDAEAYYLLGSLLSEQGEHSAAIGALKQAVDVKPSLAPAHFLLGRLYEGRGSESDRERALASYGQAAQQAPDEVTYLREWARLLYQQGQWEGSAAALRRVLDLDPGDALAYYYLGKAEEALGHLQDSLQAYDRAVALAPDNPDFLEAKALLLRQSLELRCQASEPIEEPQYAELMGLWDGIARLRDSESAVAYRERGLAAVLFSRDEQAAQALARALALAPDDPLLRRQRAQALQRLGRHEEALVEAKAAAHLQPDVPGNHDLLAQSYLHLGRHEEAARALERAIALAPGEANCHHDLAETLAKLGQTVPAVAALERAVALEPGQPSWYHRLGQLRSGLGLHAKAVDAYRQAVTLSPHDAAYEHDLAQALARTGSLAEATETLEHALELAPGRDEWLIELGQWYEQAQRYDLAHQRYRQAAELQGDAPQHLVHLARAAYLVGEEEEARQVLVHAIELSDRWEPAFEALGDFHSHYGRHREAVEAYLQATALEPGNAVPHFKLGQALHQVGQYDQAVDYLERAAALDPYRADIFTELGDVHQYLQHYDEAMQAYQQAVVLAPGKTETLYRLAHLCRELGYLDQARAHYQSLAAMQPDESVIYAHLGSIYADKGDYEKALQSYLTAIERDPAQAPYYYHMGLIYKQLREYKKAGHYFRQTVKLDPNNRDAYKQFAAVSALSFLGQ